VTISKAVHRPPNRGNSSLEVDDELERGGLLDGEISWLGALEDLVHEDGGTTIQVRIVRDART
jgi:hypothetical protein